MNSTDLCSPEITELAKAMIQVQQSLNPALKDQVNPFTQSRYATLNSVIDTCRDTLISNGIWVAQYPVSAEQGHIGLVTKLIHVKSGQWQSSLMVMPLPKNDPQGYGSALTYARRYGLATLIGLTTESDDDAEGAMPRNPNSSNTNQGKPTQTPRALGPQLAGVQYQPVQAQDGRSCIKAIGATRSKADLLKKAGFRWDQKQKIWWKYADIAA
ncbi:ERF family protein [Maridesulfovibrio ferrireducens]|uniref:ERF family protein n=1 Tax=Maridesulfovibrio ferrireducens TaxID=246191 RepID=UPI001A28CCB1|nr:ERF family protein [Maridesulfovibrio ferrireducens]MBI9109959.1 ERF family protein [Maridesulfovibrio ferrireducens]